MQNHPYLEDGEFIIYFLAVFFLLFLKRATRASKRASIIDGIKTDNGGRGGNLFHEEEEEEEDEAFGEASEEADDACSGGGDEQRDLIGREGGRDLASLRVLEAENESRYGVGKGSLE